MFNKNYDYAAEMLKIADSEEHKKLFQPMVKEAFSREGKEEPSEVEEEMKKLSKQASSSSCACDEHCKDCSCVCHKDEHKAEDQNYHYDSSSGSSQKPQLDNSKYPDSSSKSAAFPLNAVQSLMKISEQLELQGMDKIAAASLVLAEAIVKEAKKKVEKSKSKTKSSTKTKSSKPMSQKEKMEAMRKAKEKKEKASKSSSSSTKKAQDQQAAVRQMLEMELGQLSAHLQLVDMAFQPATKQIAVVVKAAANQPHPSAQQLGAYLTGKVQGMAPGFKVVATVSF